MIAVATVHDRERTRGECKKKDYQTRRPVLTRSPQHGDLPHTTESLRVLGHAEMEGPHADRLQARASIRLKAAQAFARKREEGDGTVRSVDGARFQGWTQDDFTALN